ncbi:hypothetical protein Tco_0863491 [Tanacetum coccineum]
MHPLAKIDRRGGQVRAAIAPNQRAEAKRQQGRTCKGRKEKGNPQQRKSRSNLHGPTLAADNQTKSHPKFLTEVEDHLIHHMYVDRGSTLEVLYEQCFNKLRPKVKSRMIPATAPLLGFSGEISWPLGKISLMVSLGDGEHSTSALMNFMVVRSPSPYHDIIGRPCLKKIQSVPSTAHEMLKFPVERGIVTLHNSI